MKHTSQKSNISLTAAEIGGRWAMHPSAVLKIMKRFGCVGAKFGTTRQAARRFSWAELKSVEAQVNFNPEMGGDDAP